MVLKLNLDLPSLWQSSSAGSSWEPLQGGGLTNSTTIKTVLLFLPLQSLRLQDIQGHREAQREDNYEYSYAGKAIRMMTKWGAEGFISGHYSFCNGLFRGFFKFIWFVWLELIILFFMETRKRDSILPTGSCSSWQFWSEGRRYSDIEKLDVYL